MPRGHEHISFVFLSALRDIFSQSFLRIRMYGREDPCAVLSETHKGLKRVTRVQCS